MTIEEILSQHVKFDRRGKELVFLCPFHEEKTPSCSMNMNTGMFHCFGCKKGGSLSRFLSLLGAERIDYDIKFDIKKEEVFRDKVIINEGVLSYFQYQPKILIEQGFDEELLWSYKIGFHIERKRNIFPIRDEFGNLLGVSGGSICGGSPKYKVYRGCYSVNSICVASDYGSWFDEMYPEYGTFDKTPYLWNFHRVVKEDYTSLIIVEGFKAALALIQKGHLNVVALMGSNLSDEQLKTLKRYRIDILLMLDNDLGGQTGTKICIKKMFEYLPLFKVNYESKQPDDLTKDALDRAISGKSKITKTDWLKSKEQ
jgi:DNA primase